MPYKCSDETCRTAPTDCPVPLACTNPATPYRCTNGACAASPYDTVCEVSPPVPCSDPKLPVKCPSTYECVASVSQCSVATAPAANPADPTTWPAACPPSWARCRDGSCKLSVSSCDAQTCPLNLPYLCATGVCARNSTACPNLLTGCYAPLVGCATTGACVADPDDQTVCPPAGPNCVTTCGDGMCISETDAINYNSLCSSHECALRCADKTCGLTTTQANITADTYGNLCTQSGTQTPLQIPLKNQCPLNLPYRCSSGLCAVSSLECISVASSSFVCPSDTPVQCANSACVVDPSQCPILYPCDETKGEMRCGDGSCRVRLPLDLGNECTSWGIANTCPMVSPNPNPLLPPTQRYRCPTGLCANGDTLASCIDLTTGCPEIPDNAGGIVTKCPNGACIPQARWGGYNNSVDACAAPALQPPQADGCPFGTSKCTLTGECFEKVADCPNALGCSPKTPFRCTAPGADSGACASSLANCTAKPASGGFQCASGEWVLDATKCKLLNGCDVDTPIRCANGACAKYGTSALLLGATLSEVCAPTVTCPTSQFLCYDGSCAVTSSLCSAAVACTKVLCSDRRTCVDSAASCLTGIAGNVTAGGGATATGSIALSACPTAVPILCNNGQCVSSITSCPTSGSAGSGTGTGVLGTILTLNAAQTSAVSGSTVIVQDANKGSADLPSPYGRCSAATPLECFDGSCAARFSDCRDRAVQLRGAPPGSNASSTAEGACPSGSLMCPLGECTPDPYRNQSGLLACAVIPACGDGTYRCPDGSCVGNLLNCKGAEVVNGQAVIQQEPCPLVTFPGYLAVQTQRCQDGQCRYVCPAYDGCPSTIPYQCSNRECARSSGECATAAMGHAFSFQAVRPFLSPPLVAGRRRLLQASGAASSTGSSAVIAPSEPVEAPVGTWCYSDCVAQLKAWSYTTMVDPTINQKMVVTTDDSSRDFAWITAPAGSLVFANRTAAALAGQTRVSVTIAPVADSVVRAAENRVPSSRLEVASSGFLTFVQTVLSPMFELKVDAAVALPFKTNITITSHIDMNNLNARTPGDYSDICLAELHQLPEIGFAAWRCLYSCTKGTGANMIDVRCSVRDASSSGDAAQVSGSVGKPGIYAFVETPVAQPIPASKLSWVQENALWLFLGLTAAAVFIFGVFYCAQRLYRYRGKYKEEAKAVQAQMEEVDVMEQFGGQAGTKDDEVAMMSNPMVVQMKDMQAKLDETQLKIREQENQQKQEATVVRHEHISALAADRDALMEELDRLKSEINRSNVAAASSRPQAVHMEEIRVASIDATGVASVVDVAEADAAAGAVEGEIAADQPQVIQRAEFQAQRPKKKVKDMD